ncbi:MAG: polyphosphate polymerase domain-containing protein [Clostridiales bacterium]|nr:polyphosphate polymerase domain-containing protein [Clostridiales bacterium]
MSESVFERKEIKYILTNEQHEGLVKELEGRMEADKYGLTKVCNIYFDTPNFRLIRESIEKPKYKEKLRLRTYGIPTMDSPAFIELKKKLMGMVHKRREILPYGEAMEYLVNGVIPSRWSQIFEEIDWVLYFYEGLAPAMVLCYDRIAYVGTEDPQLRLTFDSNVTFRTDDLDLMHGAHGQKLLEDGTYIMELKIQDAMPLWLSGILDKLKIYPGSYTKYGNAYKKFLNDGGIV